MDETHASLLRYYACQGPLTDPGDHAALFDDLPTTVPALCKVAQGLMIRRAFTDFYGLRVANDRSEEAEPRYVSDLLSRIVELDGRPLTSARPPEKRLLIVCRDFATMLSQPTLARAARDRQLHPGRAPPGALDDPVNAGHPEPTGSLPSALSAETLPLPYQSARTG